MSLKTFHIFFIIVSVLFSLGFSVWAFLEYARLDQATNLIFGVGALVLALILMVYGRWFLRKLRGVE